MYAQLCWIPIAALCQHTCISLDKAWLMHRAHSEGDWLLCAADYSVFVGDLAPDVTDYALQENFRHFFASVRSAKVLPHLP